MFDRVFLCEKSYHHDSTQVSVQASDPRIYARMSVFRQKQKAQCEALQHRIQSLEDADNVLAFQQQKL